MPFKFTQEQFDAANESNNSREFTPVPDGKYCVSLLNIEDKERVTKSGNTHEYLAIQARYEGGQYNNRREFVDLVYENSGSEAHGSIGRKQILSLWNALGGTGAPSWDDLTQSVGKKFQLVIKTTPSKDPQYGPNRNFYFNPCSSDCSESCSGPLPGSLTPSDGVDIWS